jgi:hypothetical protein
LVNARSRANSARARKPVPEWYSSSKTPGF